jgi:hypothetical protein
MTDKPTEYTTCPEGRKDWYYTLFGPCFAKLYVDKSDKKYYHKVLWFKYTTDGKSCEGVYVDNPDDYYFDEIEVHRPDCFFFCGITMRFIRRRICCISYDD